MRLYISLFMSVFLGMQLSAQTTVKMSAVKSNNYGVAYFLPKTAIRTTLTYSKVTQTAGMYSSYAERYLSISDPIVEDKVSYSLEKIEVNAVGVIDKDKSYMVQFKSNSVAPFVTLSKDGLICAINGDYNSPKEEEREKPKSLVSDVSVHSFMSEEVLRAGSTAKQAELIAKQIYRLRESRNDILTGDADNMPPDGDAYKLVMGQLDEQEKALTELFIGSEKIEPMTKDVNVIPNDADINEAVISRFSSKQGVLDANDLSGVPIYMSLKRKAPRTAVILSLKETQAREKKFSQGIVYNIPAKASLQMEYKNKVVVDKDCDVVQFGDQEVLVGKMFDNKKTPIKVVFYPDLGAIKQIIEQP